MVRSTGAAVAFMNPGGIRADVKVAARGTEGDGVVTFGEVFEAQPFGNVLHTVTLTGAEILEVLDEQFADPNRPRILQPSQGFSYSYEQTDAGPRVLRPSVRIQGKALAPAKSYRVTVSDFLFNGGDGYRTFKKGRELAVGQVDIDALVAHFEHFGAKDAEVAVPNAGRIVKVRK
jgi:5'-nucleotidase